MKPWPNNFTPAEGGWRVPFTIGAQRPAAAVFVRWTMHMKRIILAFTTTVSVLGWLAWQTLAADGSTVSLKDLAGDYFFGDGTGVNCSLVLTKQGTFAFTWRGCLGTYDENTGGASLKDGVLHITPKKPNVRKGFRGTPTDFFPVRWDTRMYLIPTNDIVEFCSEVNQGGEPRGRNWGEYYLRRNDWDKAVTGLPSVPEPWTKYFLSKPVSGKITQLIGKQEAWFNRGTEHGLLQGMILTAQDYGKLMFSQVKVVAVEKNRCRIKCEWKDSKLAVGQTVSSRFHE